MLSPFFRRDFYMIRHGQTNHNGEELASSEDTPLNEIGIAQAAAHSGIFDRLCCDSTGCYIVTSELPRAKHTAHIMLGGDEGHVQPPPPHKHTVYSDHALNERANGDLGGRAKLKRLTDVTKYQVSRGRSADLATLYKKGTETIEVHGEKVCKAVNRHLRECPQDKTPVFVAHKGSLQRVAETMGYPFNMEFHNAGVYHFEPVPESNRWTINRIMLTNNTVQKTAISPPRIRMDTSEPYHVR